MTAALNFGVREGWFYKAPHIRLGRVPPPRDRWLTPDEQVRLIAAAEGHVRTFVILGVHTGARKGAILGLTWDRVDFDRGMVTYVDPDRAETKKKRAVVPMNATVRAALVRAREKARTEYVIEYHGAMVGNVKKAFARACQRAGLEGVTPHVLRHTCATRLAMAGVSLDEIADYLAADPATISRHYRKFQPDYLRRAADALDPPTRKAASNE